MPATIRRPRKLYPRSAWAALKLDRDVRRAKAVPVKPTLDVPNEKALERIARRFLDSRISYAEPIPADARAVLWNGSEIRETTWGDLRAEFLSGPDVTGGPGWYMMPPDWFRPREDRKSQPTNEGGRQCPPSADAAMIAALVAANFGV